MAKRSTGPSEATKLLVLTRASNACERCYNSVVDRPSAIHHRSARRMGGNKTAWINEPPNLVLVCDSCHRWIEGHAYDARDTGWIVPSWGTSETTPITDKSGGVFDLGRKGEKSKVVTPDG